MTSLHVNPVVAPDIPPDLRWLSSEDDRGSLGRWRGRVVLLDFWTRSCVNCAQAGVELDRLVAPYGDRVQLVGVHSPRFPAERSLDVVRAGAAQLGISHPVVNDPDLRLWGLYGLQAWPTVVVIGPDGSLVTSAVGESEISRLGPLLARLARFSTTGPPPPTVSRTGSSRGRELRHPNRLLAVGPDRWLVSEERGDMVVVVGPDFEIEARFEGFVDPRGLCELPDGRIAVADTGRHQVVALDPESGLVEALVGTGRRGERRVRPGTPGREADLASPHDVAVWGDRLVIAVAGHHQLLAVPAPAVRSGVGPVEMVAGSSAEGHKDGMARRARLAMPTALLATPDRLWFVDADSSLLRWVGGRQGDGAEVQTASGRSPATSGHVDGPAQQALLQHPAGLAMDRNRRILIADVFNGAVRRFDPATGQMETVSSGLAEPTAVATTSGTTDDGAEIVVVERAANRLTRHPLRPRIETGPRSTFGVPSTKVRSRFELVATGARANLVITAEPPELVESVTGTGAHRIVELGGNQQRGVIRITVNAECDEVCTLDHQTWSIPVELDPDGTGTIPLILR
ncbi:MAG: hypothetical protein GY724_22715 [Actinomycetia bacterium]|nr:hypothetical protein [Actinomycetes bacterium]